MAIRGRLRKRFSWLRDDPNGRRMRGHIDVEDPAALMLDDKETVQNSEGHGRHGEEVEGDDRLAVVANKGQPPLGWITSALDRPQIACDGPLGEHEAELLQFAVDLGRA